MRVKVCGITNIDDALLCESLGADALGFIFYPKSKRYIQPEKAKSIIENLSPFILKVGVFVDEDPDEINKIASEINLSAVQLSGDEDFTIINKLKRPVIKTFRIKNNFDFSQLEKFNGSSFLLDSHSKEEFGGTGQKFDWELIPNTLKNKIILAGGVSTENIEFIYKNIKPAAVDLSSSLEKEPGKKDEKKVREFFRKFNSLRNY
jgi:phosphoribosylanthranilate isomerase